MRKETARFWNRLVKPHKYNRRRHRKWFGKFDLNTHFKGRFDLHSQTFQVCIWKQSAIKVKGNRIFLSNGCGRKPLRFKLPRTMPMGKIVQAELGFRELRLTISYF